MNSGVMKYVGEAMRDYWLTAASTVPAVALGIANWGSVKNREDLQDDFVRGFHLATFDTFLMKHFSLWLNVPVNANYTFSVLYKLK